jgi:hypothetical protein
VLTHKIDIYDFPNRRGVLGAYWAAAAYLAFVSIEALPAK